MPPQGPKLRSVKRWEVPQVPQGPTRCGRAAHSGDWSALDRGQRELRLRSGATGRAVWKRCSCYFYAHHRTSWSKSASAGRNAGARHVLCEAVTVPHAELPIADARRLLPRALLFSSFFPFPHYRAIQSGFPTVGSAAAALLHPHCTSSTPASPTTSRKACRPGL